MSPSPLPGAGILETLAVFVVAAAVLSLAGRVLRMPSIVAYLVAGLVVGPLTGWVIRPESSHDALEVIAEMGIVLLMFLVGLELSLARIRQVGRVAVAAGVGQVAFTAIGGFGIAMALGFTWIESLFITTALTFSSTVVVVRLLDQKGDLQSLYGRIAVGIFLVQDLVVVIILTLLAGLGRPDDLSPLAVATGVGKALGGMVLLLGFSLLAARHLLPRPMSWAARTPRLLFMGSLGWCFGYVLAAEAMGLSLEIGAFLAGLSMAQHGVADDLRRRMHPLMSFFVAVFFVSLGAGMELEAATTYWREALVLSLFVLIGNPFIFMWIITRYGYSERTSFMTSVTVAQISEFSFIFMAMGVGMGLVEPRILSLVGVVGIVTIALSAYMILYSEPLYALVSRLGLLKIFRGGHHVDPEAPVVRPHDHVLVVGMNDLGRRVVEGLAERGIFAVAVDTDPACLEDLPCRTLHGDVDAPATLEEAGLEHALVAVSALRIEAVNKLFAFRCREAGVPVVLLGADRWIAEELREVGADHVVESKREAGLRLVEALGRVEANR